MIFVTNDDVMGKNIRYLRQRWGLTLEELAEIAGLSSARLYDIEVGICMEIDARALENICSFFHMDVQTIVERNLAEICSI